MTEKDKELERLYKEYGITDKRKSPPTPKKKEKNWLQSAWDALLERLKIKQKKGITRPAGVRTPEQIKEWKEIMRETGRKNQ